ncbi:hypothetical protein [Aquicella lusitana]|uniref:Uncharacterized protein n=1 Tax=Aquicella lusitana TaxID=254246 RepID=A0A370GDZ3_9COXI|nr:hypothetical protein [Aquicella lusitana]RDI40213.1 hypothetical protein C8D86_12349 [Aquicella lusitana]VVC72396.1 hypothetical protein AQULUS_01060 [Aquicella lusitana]
MRSIIVSGLVILLSGCATTTNNYYTKTVDSWRGGHVSALVKQWGPPDQRVTGTGGNTVYVYKTESYHSSGGTASPSVGVHFSPGGKPVMTTTPSLNPAWNRGMTLACMATFEVNSQGIITETKTLGNACYGSESFASRMRNPSAP